MEIEFRGFPKMARLSRDMIITEKLDGTNASIYIGESGEFLVGSRTRWITPSDDNFGFAAWTYDNKEELLTLGVGHHYGEWYGRGIQRNYGLTERRFSLFNVSRWSDDSVRPACCHVVPTLGINTFDTSYIQTILDNLKQNGSVAVPGFARPEGIVVYHCAAQIGFKKLLEHDELPKSLVK